MSGYALSSDRGPGTPSEILLPPEAAALSAPPSPSPDARPSWSISRNLPAFVVVGAESAALAAFAWAHPADTPAAAMLFLAVANATLTLADGKIEEAWAALRRLEARCRAALRRPIPSEA